MTPERWKRVEQLYHEALARGAQRARGVSRPRACRETRHCGARSSRCWRAASTMAFLADLQPPCTRRMSLDLARRVMTGAATRGLSDCSAARRRRHGRGVPRARHEAGPRRRDQDPAAAFTPRSRPARALRARSALLAALNHPHIGAIYGLEEADGVRASCWSSSRARRWRTNSRSAGVQPQGSRSAEALDHRAADRRRARSRARARASFTAI